MFDDAGEHELKCIPAVLDGEVVVFRDGRQSFEVLQLAMRRGRGADVAFLAFDLIRHDGEGLRSTGRTSSDVNRWSLFGSPTRLRSVLASTTAALLTSDH